MANDFNEDAEEIARLYVNLLKKKLQEEDVAAVAILVPLSNQVAELTELLINTAEIPEI